jgi:hypothetical protein
MRKFITLLLLVVSTSLFGQNFEYLDSVFIKHTYKGVIVTRYLDPTEDLLVGDYMRIATDESMNLSISDSLNSKYSKTKNINSEKLLDELYNSIDDISIDSNCNALLIKISQDSCDYCVNAIIKEIIDYNDIMNVIKVNKVKSIYANYFQLSSGVSYITVTVKRRFKLSDRFVLYLY